LKSLPLPGTSFVVNGAAPARDAALTSAAAELRLANGLAFIGKFDGEFGGTSQHLRRNRHRAISVVTLKAA
jgi:hypothetical protein